jgi:hypothetical protein
VIFGDIPGGHTECMGLLDHSFAMYARTPASNIAPGSSPDERLSCQSVQSLGRIVGIATYEPRPEGCSCYYAGTVNKRQDHFASFPPELAERCIRAGTSERGCCAACGAPWVRVTERVAGVSGETLERPKQTAGMWDGSSTLSMSGHHGAGWRERGPQQTTTGWSASCTCEAATVPCTILDPFSGAGTALLVADRLGRDAIGIDLSHAYVEMTRERLRADSPLFMDIGPSPPPAEDPEDARMGDLFAIAAD